MLWYVNTSTYVASKGAPAVLQQSYGELVSMSHLVASLPQLINLILSEGCHGDRLHTMRRAESTPAVNRSAAASRAWQCTATDESQAVEETESLSGRLNQEWREPHNQLNCTRGYKMSLQNRDTLLRKYIR